MDIPVEEHFTIEQCKMFTADRRQWLGCEMTAADEERIIGLAFDTLDGGEGLATPD